jgi:hypothetical protein
LEERRLLYTWSFGDERGLFVEAERDRGREEESNFCVAFRR